MTSESIEIHTLNGRDSVLLDVAAIDTSASSMREAIVEERLRLGAMLQKVGIDYGDFRSALIPQKSRHEGAFLFDSTWVEGGDYGEPIYARMAHLMEKTGRHSVLTGDLIGLSSAFIEVINEAFAARLREPIHSSTQVLAVYITNMSARALAQIRSGLLGFEPYLDFVDTTFNSPWRDVFSWILPARFVKAGRYVIGLHDGDDFVMEDTNLHGWNFDDRYTLKSVSMLYFDLFLSYKIERTLTPTDESDILHGLSAIGLPPSDHGKLQVRVDDGKFKYARDAHGSPLARAGINVESARDLEVLISEKVWGNYFYDLRFDATYDFSSLAVMIETPRSGNKPPAKFKVVLKYDSNDASLNLHTLM